MCPVFPRIRRCRLKSRSKTSRASDIERSSRSCAIKRISVPKRSFATPNQIKWSRSQNHLLSPQNRIVEYGDLVSTSWVLKYCSHVVMDRNVRIEIKSIAEPKVPASEALFANEVCIIIAFEPVLLHLLFVITLQSTDRSKISWLTVTV